MINNHLALQLPINVVTCVQASRSPWNILWRETLRENPRPHFSPFTQQHLSWTWTRPLSTQTGRWTWSKRMGAALWLDYRTYVQTVNVEGMLLLKMGHWNGVSCLNKKGKMNIKLWNLVDIHWQDKISVGQQRTQSCPPDSIKVGWLSPSQCWYPPWWNPGTRTTE
jgi:hypothetical protein